MDDKMIRLFCSDDVTRKALCNPFNLGEFTFATNGHFGIRIPIQHEYDGNEPIKNVDGVICYGKIQEQFWIELPPLDSVVEISDCKHCKGLDNVTECPECEGTGEVSWESEWGHEYEAECLNCNGRKTISGECEECGGSGKNTRDKNVRLGTKLLNGRLLSIMSQLQGLKIAPDAPVDKYKPIPFKFDGGTGIIMPMRELT
jgi:hypothetical protein